MRSLFLSQKQFTRFFDAKTINAFRPESFCALKVAIRKVQTFWTSAEVMHSAPGGYASVPGGYAKILKVMRKFLEAMVLFQMVLQPIVGIE